MSAYKIASACAGAILGMTVAVSLVHPSTETNDGKFSKAEKLDALGSRPGVECPMFDWPYGCKCSAISRTNQEARRPARACPAQSMRELALLIFQTAWRSSLRSGVPGRPALARRPMGFETTFPRGASPLSAGHLGLLGRQNRQGRWPPCDNPFRMAH